MIIIVLYYQFGRATVPVIASEVSHSAEKAADDHLYRQIARSIERQVNKDVYTPGERVPSVRRLSAQLKVSVGTVLEAYRLLEDEGVLEVRPQSGYYARLRKARAPAEPEMSRPPRAPTAVSNLEFASHILESIRRPDLVQLGVSAPHTSFLPTRQINRIAGAILRRDDGSVHRYDYPPGLPALRRQIARRMLDAGCDLSPDEIVITGGCREAVTLCLRAVARPGDVIAVESPTYYGTLQAIEALGMKALEIPTHPQEGISLEALEFAIERHDVKACALLLNFSNPVGACMSDQNKQKLVRLLAQHEIPLIEDDIFGDLAYAKARPKVAKAFDRKGLVLSCSSFSKTISPGFRIGWAVPGRFQLRVEHLKYVSTIAAPSLQEMAIAEFLSHGRYERHLRATRMSFQQNAKRMNNAIARHFPEDTRVSRPAGGFLSWIQLSPGVDALELHRLALAAGISVAPGPLFSAKRKYQDFIRLTYAIPWDERVEQALHTLGRLTKSMA